MNNGWQCGFTGTDAAPGTNEGGFALQGSSRLAGERGHTESGDPQERQRAPFLKKAGWYAVAIAGVALLAWLPWHPFGIRASVDVESLHAALTMVSLGISLTIIVIGWSSLGGRTRADTLALIRAFLGIAILSAAYLLFTGLAQSDTSTYAVLSGVLHPGMGLTVVTGMLAESLLFLAVGSAQARLLYGDLYRLGGFLLIYSALFHQVARGPYIELQRAEAFLRTEQERLARARQIAKLGSWEWDLRSDAVWTSDEVRHMFGIPADKIRMTRAEFVDLVFRDDRERLRAAAQAELRRIERYAQLLAENNGARMDETGRDMLQHIQVALSRTKQLIADILKLAQVTRAELRHVAVDLSAMARRAIEQMERATSPARQVDVSVEPGIVVQGDVALLQILLDNLLGNAWKFTARTERPSIRIGSIEPAQGKGFYIKDNGAGFDMRYAYKLFSAFQRLHGQEDFKGTGIGLAIVQRIVNLHGWQIQANSETGRGATFTIKA